MAEGLNRVMLIGNLGQDPDLRFTQGGGAVLNMRLAATERYKDRNGEWKDQVEWVTVVLWGKRAEALSKILRKGTRLFVEGALRTSSYDGKDGQKKWKTEVNARNVILCGGGERARSDRTPPPPPAADAGYGYESDDDGVDSIPF